VTVNGIKVTVTLMLKPGTTVSVVENEQHETKEDQPQDSNPDRVDSILSSTFSARAQARQRASNEWTTLRAAVATHYPSNATRRLSRRIGCNGPRVSLFAICRQLLPPMSPVIQISH
jgi:hypothetical protein